MSTTARLAQLRAQLDALRQDVDAFRKQADGIYAKVQSVLSFVLGLPFLIAFALPIKASLAMISVGIDGFASLVDALDNAADSYLPAPAPTPSAPIVTAPPTSPGPSPAGSPASAAVRAETSYDPTKQPERRDELSPALVSPANPLGCGNCFGTGQDPDRPAASCPTCATPAA